jgi:hypothetical protein
VSEALAAELASIIQLKLLLWPPEMVLPVLDAIRQLILLEEVAMKLYETFRATNGENNFLTMTIAAAFIGDSNKSAPRIFALRCVANSFQHQCLHPLLAEDGEQLFQLLEMCGSSPDERERQAYADVLMKYDFFKFRFPQLFRFCILGLGSPKAAKDQFMISRSVESVSFWRAIIEWGLSPPATSRTCTPDILRACTCHSFCPTLEHMHSFFFFFFFFLRNRR